MGILLTDSKQLTTAGKDSRLLVVFAESYLLAKTGIYLLGDVSEGMRMAELSPSETGLTDMNPLIIQLDSYLSGKNQAVKQITLLPDSDSGPDFVLGCLPLAEEINQS